MAGGEESVSRQFLQKLSDYRGLFYGCDDRDDNLNPIFNVSIDRNHYSVLVTCRGEYGRDKKTGEFYFKGFKTLPLELQRIFGGRTEIFGDTDLNGVPDYVIHEISLRELGELWHRVGEVRIVNDEYLKKTTKANLKDMKPPEIKMYTNAFTDDLTALMEAMDNEVKRLGLTPPIPIKGKKSC